MPLSFDDIYGPAATNSYSALVQAYGGSSMPSGGSGSSGSSSTASTEPRVYIGSHDILGPIPGSYFDNPSAFINAKPNAHDVSVDRLPTISKAATRFDRMTAAEQHDMVRLLVIAGYFGKVDLKDVDEAVKSIGLLDARSAYIDLLNDTSSYNSSGLKVTPSDVLRSAVAYRLQAEGVRWDGDLKAFDKGLQSFAEDLAEKGEDLSGTFTTTTKSVNIMDPMDAKYLTRGMLQQELGRDPTQAEYEDFLSAVNAAERHNPSISKHTVTTDEEGRVVNQKTVTHGGISSAGINQMLYNKAQAQPGWAEWQAMGTYAPALFAALGATVPGA